MSQNLQNHSAGHFGYSATKLHELGATEYTLGTIVSDDSGSVSQFKAEMENSLKEIIGACKHSPRADNLMLRHIVFNDSVRENHGFKLLSAINDSDYDNCLKPSGSTALFDATINAIESTSDYAKKLVDASYNVNAVVFIITDGDNNSGMSTVKMVKESLDKVSRNETLESIVTILIAVNVNDPYISGHLDSFAKSAGITQYVEMKDASKKSLAKLAAFVSKSISAQSKALGTGVSGTINNASLTI